MTLFIDNVCALTNRTEKLPRHVGAMSWHHAKFHDFQACFGFTGIKKPSFSIFPATPRRPVVWISFPFLLWDLEIHPRTHMWFFNQLWCTGACACSSNLNMHIKLPEIQLMYKKAKPRIIPNFSTTLQLVYVASVKKSRHEEAAYGVSPTKVTCSLSEPWGF